MAASDVEIERALASLTATLNDHLWETWDREQVQQILTGSLGGERHLLADEGGGIHDVDGERLAVIRRTDSGEWVSERQNRTAERSDTAVPATPPKRSA